MQVNSLSVSLPPPPPPSLSLSSSSHILSFYLRPPPVSVSQRLGVEDAPQISELFILSCLADFCRFGLAYNIMRADTALKIFRSDLPAPAPLPRNASVISVFVWSKLI